MVYLENYDLFVDERTSKSGKTYYGLFIKLDELEQLICFINYSVYEKIAHLSK